MEDFGITRIYKTIATNQIVNFLLYGGGTLAFLKASLYFNGMKIISFIRVYKNKKKFLKDELFEKINTVMENPSMINNIHDLAKKEIANDILYIELFRIKQILKMNLKFIFKTGLLDYLMSWKNFNSKEIVCLFENEYINSKKNVEHVSRNRFTKNGYMSQDDFNRFWRLYQEINIFYELNVYESLNMLKDKKNIYETIWGIMNTFNINVEIYCKLIGSHINALNGRLDGVMYKGLVVGQSKKKQLQVSIYE